MSNARETALRVLIGCRTKDAWADAALKAQIQRDGLTAADAALCSRMVYGVLQNQFLLDYYLGAYCSQRSWRSCGWALIRSCIWTRSPTTPR